MARTASRAPAQRASRFPRYLEVQAGPWNTLNDSLDTYNAAPDVAKRLDNVYSLDGASTLGRPGVVKRGGVAPGTLQAHGQLTTPSGTEITYRIANGVIQTYSWGGDAWTTQVSAANLTTAGITLSTTARCACVNFNGKLVVSDGINKAFQWDGTAGAGGLAILTQASSAWYGMPWVKDAKLFAIQNAGATSRRTIEWSNENDATAGYATASQTWTLGQVSETPLTAGVGLNDAMVVFRERMHQPIIGQVTATFKTSATRASLSENIGTASPFAMAVWNNRIFFIDADGRPQVTSASTGMLYDAAVSTGPDSAPIWKNVREFSKTVDRTKLATKACAAIFPALNLVMLGFPQTTSTHASVWVMIDPLRNVPVSLWSGFEFVCPAQVKDASGVPYVMLGDGSNYSYTYGDLNAGPFDDQLNSGTVAVAHAIEGTPLSPDRDTEAAWTEASLTLRLYSNQTLGVSFRSPNGTTSAQTTYVTGAASFWDSAVWDTSKWSSDATERNVNVGMRTWGRWVAPIITHATVGEQFGIVGITVHGAQMRDDPSVR